MTAHLPADLLLERDAEMAALQGLLGAASAANGHLVVVEGSAGIGKTRLLAEARLRAESAGFDVLTARGGELEGQFAFGMVRQLFEARLAGALPEARAALFDGAAGLSASLFASAPASASGYGAESSFAMLHGLYWLAANFAACNPMLLVVDDLHWSDEPSLRWFHYLARRLDGLQLLVLAGTRPPEQANLPVLVSELVADPGAVVIRPRSLGRDSAATLARRRFGAEPAPAFAAALDTGSGGNPLYLVALLDAVWQQGLEPTAEYATRVLEIGPRAVAYGVSNRLSHLPPEATLLLHAAAILGDRTEIPLAAAFAEIDVETALTAASALVRGELLRRENPLEFAHPVVRSAVLERMSAQERSRAYRRAATLLLDRGAVPEQAATYYVRTVPSGDHVVVAALRRAAAQCFARGAPEAAAAYLGRALEEPPGLDDRAEVLGELGFVETHTDAVAAAEHLSQAIPAISDPTRRTAAVLAYSHVLNLFGRDVRLSAELLLEASGRLGDDESGMADRIDALLIIACRYDATLYPVAAAQWQKRFGQVSERKLGSGLLLAVGSIQEALRGVSRPTALDLARKALASEILQSEDRIYLTSALAAMAMTGETDEALAGFEKVIAASGRSGDRLTAAGHRLWMGLVHYESGQLLLAEQDLILEEIPFWRASTPLAYRTGFLTQVLLERGLLDAAKRLMADTSLDDVQDLHRVHCIYARGRLRLESGLAGTALDDFLEVGGLTESVEVFNPAFVPWRSHAALALQRLGRRDEARELARKEAALSRAWGAPRTVGISLRALGLVEGGPTGESSLREAVDVLASSPARLEHARALVDLGAALRRGNSRSEARKRLREGAELAHRCGAAALVDRANEELAASGAHPRTMPRSGLDALTASERRVAQMAAEDLSNKEIAQALFVTVKTVEQHLGRVYRKLDLTSRKQLSGALPSPAAAVGGR